MENHAIEEDKRQTLVAQPTGAEAGVLLLLLLRDRLLDRHWPQQLRLEEPAGKGRQDDRRETDHGAIDH